MSQSYMRQQSMNRGGPSGLADVLTVLLDKGLVIDAFVRVSLIGIELLTIDARIVVASVDTYLRFAEAVNRLDLLQANNASQLTDVIGGKSSSKRSGSASDESERDAKPSVGPGNSDSDDEDEDRSALKASEDSVGQGDAEDEDDAKHEDEQHDEDDDKGILAKVKERGKVF